MGNTIRVLPVANAQMKDARSNGEISFDLNGVSVVISAGTSRKQIARIKTVISTRYPWIRIISSRFMVPAALVTMQNTPTGLRLTINPVTRPSTSCIVSRALRIASLLPMPMIAAPHSTLKRTTAGTWFSAIERKGLEGINSEKRSKLCGSAIRLELKNEADVCAGKDSPNSSTVP